MVCPLFRPLQQEPQRILSADYQPGNRNDGVPRDLLSVPERPEPAPDGIPTGEHFHGSGQRPLSDTPTNVFPSIHVYNSVAVAVAVEHSEQLKNRPVFRNVCLGLTVLIVFSTMFLKQHSVSDVCCALVMNAGTCMLLYRPAKAGNALRTREKKAKYRM